MSKSLRIWVAAILVGVAVTFSACSTQRQVHPDIDRPDSNFLGIVKSEPESWHRHSESEFNIKTSDLVARKNYSGDTGSLLWGLIRIEDH